MVKSLSRKEFSSSAISFFWGVDRTYESLGPHTLFLADDYRENFECIIRDLSLPSNPSLYVHAPARLDPSMAPLGQDTLTAIVPVGHLSENGEQNWGRRHMTTAAEYETRTGNRRHTSYVPDIPVTPEVITLLLAGGPLRVARCILRYETIHPLQFIDITDDVERVVAMSGIPERSVTVFSKHTTAAIKINEHEPELLKDMGQLLASFAPDSGSYFHNDFTVRWVNMVEDECPNGHAHCQHLLLGTSETIPLVDAELMFGRWQRIFLIELDHGRSRDVVVSVMGC